SATDIDSVTSEADLAVTVDDNLPSHATNPGSNITYTIQVLNNGPSNSGMVTLNASVPANTTFVSFSAPAGWNVTAPNPSDAGPLPITATISDLPPSATPITFTLIVNVNSNLNINTSITESVTVSNTTDTQLTNNSDSVSTLVVPPQPDLA